MELSDLKMIGVDRQDHFNRIRHVPGLDDQSKPPHSGHPPVDPFSFYCQDVEIATGSPQDSI